MVEVIILKAITHFDAYIFMFEEPILFPHLFDIWKTSSLK